MIKGDGKVKALVVDDEPDLRTEIAAELSRHLDVVLQATDGKNALEIVLAQPVDSPIHLIVSDLKMPRMDGLTLLSELRSRKIDIPFIMVSAFYDKANLQRATQLGAIDFVEKPFSLAHLRQVVLTALNASSRQAPFKEVLRR